MRTLSSLFLTLIILLVASARAQDAREGKLIALENAWNLAQLSHDGQALDSLIGENFVYTDFDGTVMNKARFIADIKDTSYHATAITNDNMKVYLYDNFAVVTGTYHAKGTSDGKPFDHTGRFTDTWIFRNGQWQCVASHTNLLTHKQAS